MNRRFAELLGYLCIALALSVSCTGCSNFSSDSSEVLTPSHEIHVMKGYIRHVGPELDVPVEPSRSTRIHFPADVRQLDGTQGSPYHLRRNGNRLYVDIDSNLPQEGEIARIRTSDAREYVLHIRPSRERTAEYQVYDEGVLWSVADADVKAQLAPELPSNISAKTNLIQDLIAVSRAGGTEIPGFLYVKSHLGRVLVDNGAVRAVIDGEFRGEYLNGYTLTVENMTDQEQLLSRELFRSGQVLAAYFERATLAPRAPTFGVNNSRSPYQSKAYLVTRRVDIFG